MGCMIGRESEVAMKSRFSDQLPVVIGVALFAGCAAWMAREFSQSIGTFHEDADWRSSRITDGRRIVVGPMDAKTLSDGRVFGDHWTDGQDAIER